MQRHQCATGASYIYTVQMPPTVEPTFYQHVRSPLGGEPAVRVDDLAVGPASITTLILTIHHDRVYELLVEPYPLFSNQADMAQGEAYSAENAQLIEQMIATFQFAGG